jgi:predicted short-subunit dehydrogenase-like oxidoreductase (DUF2520 family)
VVNIAILGSGNVAKHLSKAIINAGHPIKQVWSRSFQNAQNLALEIGSDAIANISEIHESINLIILAVTDDAIESVVKQISNSSNRIIAHTSGSTDMHVLQQYSNHIAVLYPLQTFSKSVVIDFKKVPLFIESNSNFAQEMISKLANQLSEKVQYANSETRMSLHISAVFACNFTNHLYAIAQQILTDKNLDFNFIRPLIIETANKIIDNLPSDVQTGPSSRNDELTIKKHIKMLQNHPQWQNIYQLISQDIVKIYQPNLSDHK